MSNALQKQFGGLSQVLSWIYSQLHTKLPAWLFLPGSVH